jgi:hypothetical protein
LCSLCQIKNFASWTCGNERIDNFIQEMQLKIDDYKDIVFEWIPYSQFDKIKEMNKSNVFTVYSSIWKDGPLYWDADNKKYIREMNKKVTLRCLYNSQNIDEILNEVISLY